MLGGGMRQVGVIAAMANTALQNRESILEDHSKAKKIYEILNQDFNKRKIIVAKDLLKSVENDRKFR